MSSGQPPLRPAMAQQLPMIPLLNNVRDCLYSTKHFVGWPSPSHPFCQLIHDRGYIPAHAGFASHRNCRCTPSPEISSSATSRAAVRRGIRAAGEPGATRPGPPAPLPNQTGAGGTGRGGGGGGTGRGEAERGLLTEATARWRRTDLPAPSGLPGLPSDSPPSVEQLEAAGLMRGGSERFEGAERIIAAHLAFLGIEVRPVGRTSSFQTPDGLIIGTRQTVEMKSQAAPSFNAFRYHVRAGRSQSRRLVVRIGDPAISEDTAAEWLRRAIGRYGGGYDEVLVLGQGFGILWP